MKLERLADALADVRGSSPTIGAVLLAGLTVMMATTAGSQMLGLTDSPQAAFAAANVDFASADDRVIVTWIANGDAEALEIQVIVNDQRRTINLEEVGDRVIVDSTGVKISNGAVGSWDTPTITDGDKVSVVVNAVKNGESTTIAERTEII